MGTPFVTARRNFPTDTNGSSRVWLAGGYAPTAPTASMEIFGICGTPTPTPTATPTATSSPTATPTATATFTPTSYGHVYAYPDSYGDIHANGNGYSYGHCYGDCHSHSYCDRIAAAYTDATASPDTAASPLALLPIKGTRENELASSQLEMDRSVATDDDKLIFGGNISHGKAASV